MRCVEGLCSVWLDVIPGIGVLLRPSAIFYCSIIYNVIGKQPQGPLAFMRNRVMPSMFSCHPEFVEQLLFFIGSLSK